MFICLWNMTVGKSSLSRLQDRTVQPSKLMYLIGFCLSVALRLSLVEQDTMKGIFQHNFCVPVHNGKCPVRNVV